MNFNLVTWGTGLILLGIIMLLFTVGVLPWSAWWLLARYWPVLLIIVGVELLLRRRLTVGLLVVGAFLIVLVGGLLGASGAIGLPTRGLFPVPGRVHPGRVEVIPRGGDVSTYDLSQTRGQGVEEAEVHLTFTSGRLTVASGEPDVLARGQLEYPITSLAAVPPRVDYRESGSKACLQVSLPEKTFHRRGLNWDLYLSPDVPLDLKVDAGACRAELDLTALKIRRLDLQAGAGQINLSFGKQEFPGQVRIRAGASQVGLSVPSDVGLRITMGTALSGNNFAEAGLVRSGRAWETPGYAGATTRFEVEVEAGASQIRVQRPASF